MSRSPPGRPRNAMKPESITSPIARVAMVLLCVMWTAAGWYLVDVQTFSTRPIRSPFVTVVAGPGAVFMGGVFLLLGLMGLLLFLQSLKCSKLTQFACIVVWLLLPWRSLTQWL